MRKFDGVSHALREQRTGKRLSWAATWLLRHSLSPHASPHACPHASLHASPHVASPHASSPPPTAARSSRTCLRSRSTRRGSSGPSRSSQQNRRPTGLAWCSAAARARPKVPASRCPLAPRCPPVGSLAATPSPEAPIHRSRRVLAAHARQRIAPMIRPWSDCRLLPSKRSSCGYSTCGPTCAR